MFGEGFSRFDTHEGKVIHRGNPFQIRQEQTAFGAGAMPAGLPDYDPTYTPRVLVNPVFIDGDGDGTFSAPGGRECEYDLSAP